jgi:hypothetical protein
VGKLDPLSDDRFADLTINISSMELQPLSPYCGRFAGYELARGKLFLAVKLKVADRKIDMNSVATLDQFTFGAPTNSPDATGLPVRLGVALLKDINGKIVVDVPVEGRLDDPNFHVGKVVVRVIVNLLTKAAVSPFSMLGSMFGGGGEELAYQEFSPGSSVLRPGEEGRLQTLVKALTNRPGLTLDLVADYDAEADGHALKQQKLEGLVRRKIWEARRATESNLPPPDQLAIALEERNAMVKALFVAKFPPGTNFAAPLPKVPAPAPLPRAARPGFLSRVYNFVTLGKLRSRHAEEQKAAPAVANKESSSSAGATVSVEMMTERLMETMEISPEALRALASKRAQQVRSYLLDAGKIAPERVFLAATPAGFAEQGHASRVILQLR